MHERLVETWLDSASERSYQAPFCQLLVGSGHRIVHSTRHHPIELGKDLITIDPDGTPCAYQLKGNPGGRLTLTQFREIQQQLLELAVQPLSIPGTTRMHRSYLVTNGEVDEDVRLSLERFNRGPSLRGIEPVQIISRGQLLRLAIDYGSNLWPSELASVDHLLSMLVLEGDDELPVALLHKLLSRQLRLEDSSKPLRTQAEFCRTATSAALLTATALAKFSGRRNHLSVALGWVIYAAYVIACSERWSRPLEGSARDAVNIAEDAACSAISELIDELSQRSDYVEGNGFVDGPFFRWRITLLSAVLSAYWLRSTEEGWVHAGQKAEVEKFLKDAPADFYLWGEGAVPQLLAFHWYERRVDATIGPDVRLLRLLESIVRASAFKGGLASPYYSFADVMRYHLRDLLQDPGGRLANDTADGQSFMTDGLMALLVRTGLKQSCKSIWPDFTRVSAREFVPEEDWGFCLWRCARGVERTRQPKLTKEWAELVEESRDAKGDGIPVELRSRKFLLLLLVVFFPFRATPAAVRYLGRHLNECWFIAAPHDVEPGPRRKRHRRTRSQRSSSSRPRDRSRSRES